MNIVKEITYKDYTIKIFYAEDTQNPRKLDNLGTMVMLRDSKYDYPEEFIANGDFEEYNYSDLESDIQ